MITEDFYKCLFDEGEQTVFGNTIYETKPTLIDRMGPAVKEKNEFFVINPITPGKTRSIAGVQHFRNFMFEIDNDESGDVVPLEKQKEIITAAELPWSTCVYSGGKSLHWIVSLQQPVSDAVEYRMWWKMMETILNKTAQTLGYNIKFDSNVKDPSRFSRAANAQRRIKPGTNKLQNLVSVRGRQSNEDIIKWFTSNDLAFEDFAPKPSKFDLGQINQDADDAEKFEFVKDILMKNQPYTQGNKNTWQFVFSRLCRRCGLSETEVRYQIVQICGEVDHRDPVSSAFSDKYNNDEPIYVFSKSERSGWARRQAIDEQLNANQKIIDSGEDNELHINGVWDYIRVGTKYYKKDHKNNDLILWDKATMSMDFGSDLMKEFPKECKYTKFCNIVNFLEDIETDGREYNRFKRPKWQPLVEGDWSTTEKLLRKVFSQVGTDQWEEGLDWIQHQITNPKQSLHCLILGSVSREAGKDTFVEWMQMMLGKHNTYFADIENFLKPFNGAFAEKCLIALNEVKFSSINDGSMEKIKQYITQDTVVVNQKFEAEVTLDYYGKMIMLTNNVHDFMKIDDEENRFWIRTMPDLDKKRDFDPDFKKKLEDELPHFLHMITNRQLKYPEKLSRFWLPDTVVLTNELERIRDNSKSSLYLEIRDLFEDTFDARRDTQEILFAARDIRERVKGDISLKQISMCLQKEWKLEEKKTIYTNSFTTERKNSRFYQVERGQVFNVPDTTPGLDDPFYVK